MATSTATYAVGRGKPPFHTRFKKGQSGNPSGKPGPAKLAKQRFRRALYAALEGSTEELELAKPANGMVAMARRMVLDVTGGRCRRCGWCCRCSMRIDRQTTRERRRKKQTLFP
jgi:hypothetical protein